ncbi:unnamed protein product, partial [Meganyctiphanes norvegica]
DDSSILPLNKHDGLVMSVINKVTGKILLTRTFQTWSPYTHAQDLVWWLERVQAGGLVVLIVKRSGTYGLGAALPTLRKLGSLLVDHTPPRSLWLWVFVKGGPTIMESIQTISFQWPISLHTHLLYAKEAKMNTDITKTLHSVQNTFCNNHASMGNICNYNRKKLVPLHFNKSNTDFGVVISAGGRVQYLANAIEHLLQCPELTIDNIFAAISIDFKSGIPDSSTISLLELYGIRYRVVTSPSDTPTINHRLFQFYRGVWRVAIEIFPQSRYLVFLDEDVTVSKNWMSTLLHAAQALEADASLWCISGTGTPHPGINDPTLLLRGDMQPGWGYLVRADDVHLAAESWPDDSNDSVIAKRYLQLKIGHGRECIYPAMGRSQHFGVGVNTIDYLHQRYFLDPPFYDGPPVQLTPIHQLINDSYEIRVETQIKSATPITQDPCTKDFLQFPLPGSSLDFVFFFRLISADTLKWSCWQLLAECVGAWPYGTDRNHNYMWELPQSWGGTLWLVGVPASPYSKYMSRGYPLWPPLENLEKYIDKQDEFFQSLIPKPDIRKASGIYSNLFSISNKTLFYSN